MDYARSSRVTKSGQVKTLRTVSIFMDYCFGIRAMDYPDDGTGTRRSRLNMSGTPLSRPSDCRDADAPFWETQHRDRPPPRTGIPRFSTVLLTTLLGLSLAACGRSVGYTNDSVPGSSPGRGTAPPSMSVRYYREQYVYIRDPCAMYQDELRGLLAQKAVSATTLSARTEDMRSACLTADTAQLSAPWPGLVYAALVNQAQADVPLKRKFPDPEAIERYLASSRMASNEVRTMLGLPPR